VAGLLAVAGCAGMSMVSPPNYGRYSSSDFAWAAGGRDLRVVVRGNPSSLPDPVFRQQVVDAMQGKNPGPPTHFTLTPDASARPDYRVVLVFDAPGTLAGYEVCRGDPPVDVVAPRGRPVRVAAAFCWRDEALSDTGASAPALGPDPRPQLETLMGSLIPTLLPLENPRLRRDDDQWESRLLRRSATRVARH